MSGTGRPMPRSGQAASILVLNVKLLSDRGEIDSLHGRNAMGLRGDGLRATRNTLDQRFHIRP